MARRRAEERRRFMVSQGKCPISEILLTSKYHDADCPCGIRFGGYVVVEETIINILPQNTDEEHAMK